MSGSMSLNVRPPIDATRDWALVRLARPACTKGVLPLRVLPIEQILKRGRRQARVPDRLSSRLHAVEARLLAQPCGVAKSFEHSEWSTIARDFSDPEVLHPAHLRHGRRLVGLAACCSTRPTGPR